MTLLIMVLSIIGYLVGIIITGIYWGLLGWPRRVKIQYRLNPEWLTVAALILWPITLIFIVVDGFKGILK